MVNSFEDRLAGLSAVVTGAGQGIGAAIARGWEEGVRVMVNGRRAATLAAICTRHRRTAVRRRIASAT